MIFKSIRSIGVLGLLVALGALQPGSADSVRDNGRTPAPSTAVAAVHTILAARSFWGRDYSVLIASIPAWARVNEKTITVAPDVIFGSTPFRTPQAAETEARALAVLLAGEPLELQPPFDVAAKEGLQLAASRVDVQPYGRGESYRVVIGSGLNPLLESLTMGDVRGAIGGPQAVRQSVYEAGEDLPLVTTDYVYADGAALFETSNLGVTRDHVVSAVIDVQIAAQAVGRSQ